MQQNLNEVVSSTGVKYVPSAHVDNLLVHPEVDQLLVNKALLTRVAQPRRNSSFDVVPQVSNLDPRLHKVLLDLAHVFETDPTWHPQVDEETGLSINFVAGGASRIRSVPGVKKLPVGCAIDSNVNIRKEIAKRAEKDGIPMYHKPISEHELKMFDWVCQMYFGKVKRGVGASIRKKASTMMPDFKGGKKPVDGDIPYKKEQVKRVYEFIKK